MCSATALPNGVAIEPCGGSALTATNVFRATLKGASSCFSMSSWFADLLIAPNIEAGNMTYKNLAFMADAQIPSVAVGARGAVISKGRTDNTNALIRDPAILLPKTAE